MRTSVVLLAQYRITSRYLRPHAAWISRGNTPYGSYLNTFLVIPSTGLLLRATFQRR